MVRASANVQHFRAYLETLGAQVADPAAGFFGPRSIVWRASGEAVVYLGGMRALLLQLAHPKVAQGVADHSRFREDSRGRLLRTFNAVHAMVFGDRETAIRAAVKVYAIHTRVRGSVADSVPGLSDPGYQANDVDLLVWVFATLLDSTMVCYDLFLPPLSEAEWERFYQESKLFARLFGIEERDLPLCLADFRDWMDELIAGDTLMVTPAGRQVASALFTSSPLLILFSPINYLLAAGMLPPLLRQRFGMRWNLPLRLAYTLLIWLVRLIVRLLPRRLRLLAAARRAEQRVLGRESGQAA